MTTMTRQRTLFAGCALAMSFAPVDIGYGLIVFQVLGQGYDGLGVASGWLAVLISTAVLAWLMRSGHLYTSVRPAQTLSLAALLALVLQQQPDAAPAVQAVMALATVMVCTTLSGILQLLMAWARVGRLVSFVPRPVLSGVSSAAAIGLAVKALKTLFLLFGSTALLADAKLTDLHTWLQPGVPQQTLAWLLFVGAALWLMTWAARHLISLNWSLVGLCFGMVVYWLLEWAWPVGAGKPDLGPALPPLALSAQWPTFVSAWQYLTHVDTLTGLVQLSWPFALVVAVVNSLEALVYNARFERATEIAHDPGRVLAVLGIGNAVGGALGGLPVSLSSTKMALAYTSGVRTGLGASAHSLMLLGLIASTAWYVHLIPKVAVSLVMLYLAWMMLDAWSRVQLAAWLQPASLWRNIRQPQSTAVIFVLVILTALLSNLVWGVAFGLLCAVFVFVQRQSQTVVRRMGLLSLRRSVVMRNAAQNDCLQQQGDRALYVELQGALFFGTSEQLLKAVRAALKPDQLYLILDAHKVVEVDDSGCEAIERLQADMVRRGGALLLSAWDEALQWRSPAEIGALRQAMKQPVLRSLDEACEWVEDALIERFAPEDVRTEVCEFDPASSPLRITRYMDEKERRDFMRLLEPCQFANGSYLCRKGDASDDMHIVVCGRVDIWVKHGQRDAVRLASFRQGSSYGEMGLLRNEPRVADAVAVGEVSTLRLSRDVLERLQHEQPALLSHLLRVISEDLANRLSQTNKALRWALQA